MGSTCIDQYPPSGFQYQYPNTHPNNPAQPPLINQPPFATNPILMGHPPLMAHPPLITQPPLMTQRKNKDSI